MKKLNFILLLFLSTAGFCQISGKITDIKTKTPIDFVNIWVKNTLNGATSDDNGNFYFENASIGDTLVISYLGYEELQIVAQKENLIKLIPSSIELEEVLLIPIKKEYIKSINTYKNHKKVKEFYFNGHYSLARYFTYKKEFKKNPFIKEISTVVSSSLKNKIKFKLYLIKADENGHPSNQIISQHYLLETSKGRNEINVDLLSEKILFPKNGFFVVIERLNLNENKFSNKLASDILQPAIGMEVDLNEPNTWLGFGGRWISPNELAAYTGSDKNIAINIQLTD